MSKGFVVSFLLIFLGSVFKFTHLLIHVELFQIELWVIGLFCITLGNLGIGIYIMVSLIKNHFQKTRKFHKLLENNS